MAELAGDEAEEAICKLRRNYITANAHPFTLAALKQVKVSCRLPVDPGLPKAMMVLRYHPPFRCALRRAMAVAPIPSHFGLRILPAWSNGLPSVSTMVCRSNHANLNRVDNHEGLNEPRRVGTSFLSMPSQPQMSNNTDMSMFTFDGL